MIAFFLRSRSLSGVGRCKSSFRRCRDVVPSSRPVECVTESHTCVCAHPNVAAHSLVFIQYGRSHEFSCAPPIILVKLANAKLGAVHGFAGPLGGMIHAPHGALCAAMLPAAMEVNVTALRERGTPEEKAFYLPRFEKVAAILTGDVNADAADGCRFLRSLCDKMGIQGLRQLGLTEDRFAEAIEKSGRSSSMKGNPIQLTQAELERILTLSM